MISESEEINTIQPTAEIVESIETEIAPAPAPDVSTDNNSKPTKANKKAFDAECSKCLKHFKSKGVYDKHVGHQLCYNKSEISYCKTCNTTLENHELYVKHLMTSTHLENIGVGKLDRLKDERPGVIHTADPYLSTGEAELLGTRNLGEKYTLVFENDDIQEVKLTRKLSPLLPPILARTQISNERVPTPTNKLGNANESAAPDRITQPTARQNEIILYLEKQKNPVEANNNFIKVLTTKLTLEDYYGLTTLIRENNNISLEVKQTILGLINKFVEGLTKKRVGGQTTYNNKDIAKVVVALSM
jgi:hypothetical protein